MKADITVNKNMVPFDDRSPFVTSGIRLGTAAISTRGVGVSEMKTIAELIDQVLSDVENPGAISEVKSKVNDLMGQFPLYK